MSIFDYVEPGDYGSRTIDVTVDVLADVLGMDKPRLSGLFGAGSLGTVSIVPDESMEWADVEPEPKGTGQALLVAGRGQYKIDDVIDTDSPRIMDFCDAARHMIDEWGWAGLSGYPDRVLERYAGLLGLTYRTTTLRGPSQSDWIDAIHVADTPGRTYLVDEFRAYWEWGASCFLVDVVDALGNHYSDSLSGIINDGRVEELVLESLGYFVDDASDAAKAAKHAG